MICRTGTERLTLLSEDRELQVDQVLFDNRKRYDIFISYPNGETIECFKDENTKLEMEAKTFVDQYLVNAIKEMWKHYQHQGELTIFFENDIIHGNSDTTAFRNISSLQVLCASKINSSLTRHCRESEKTKSH